MDLLSSLNETVLYWHWVVFGIVLVTIEAVIPNFVLMWFGMGGVLVGLILWLIPSLTFTWQLLLWTVLSLLLLLLWLKYIKPRMRDRSMSGMAEEAVKGESCIVIKAPDSGTRGIVRFTTPLLGSDEWEYISEEPLNVGDRAFVVRISGNTLIVTSNSNTAATIN